VRSTARQDPEQLTPPGGAIAPRFYRLQDVATILNVRLAQVHALVRSGELRAVKLGGRGVWRVDRRQLDAYIDRLHAETAEWVRTHPPGAGKAPTLDE
jgi:excisionase family DNA binding protein